MFIYFTFGNKHMCLITHIFYVRQTNLNLSIWRVRMQYNYFNNNGISYVEYMFCTLLLQAIERFLLNMKVQE